MPAPTHKPITIEAIALNGSVVIAHERGGGVTGGKGSDITVRCGPELLIGTSITDSCLVKTVGAVAAQSIRDAVQHGTLSTGCCRLKSWVCVAR